MTPRAWRGIEDVVIDSSDPDNGPEFSLGTLGNAGTIRIGRGRDRVEWLTVVGRSESAAGVQTDLVGAAAPAVRIAHVVARGSARGIDVRNLASAGRSLTADLDDNEVSGSTAGGGQGIRFVNTLSNGASIVASSHGNYSHDNRLGFLVANQETSGASIAVESHTDRFEHNVVGGQISGGFTPAAGDAANGNSVTFTMHGGTIIDNGVLPLPPNLIGGLNVFGAFALEGGTLSDNHVAVAIRGTQFRDNVVFDLRASGALTPLAVPAGTNNTVTVELHGVSAQANTDAPIASVPRNPRGQTPP